MVAPCPPLPLDNPRSYTGITAAARTRFSESARHLRKRALFGSAPGFRVVLPAMRTRAAGRPSGRPKRDGIARRRGTAGCGARGAEGRGGSVGASGGGGMPRIRSALQCGASRTRGCSAAEDVVRQRRRRRRRRVAAPAAVAPLPPVCRAVGAPPPHLPRWRRRRRRRRHLRRQCRQRQRRRPPSAAARRRLTAPLGRVAGAPRCFRRPHLSRRSLRGGTSPAARLRGVIALPR